MSGSSRRPKTASFSSSAALIRRSLSLLESFLPSVAAESIEFLFILNGAPAAHDASFAAQAHDSQLLQEAVPRQQSSTSLEEQRKTLYVKPFEDQFGVREKIRGNERNREDFNKA